MRFATCQEKADSVQFVVMDSDIKRAISVLKDGGIVIFPTDTVYGIGCRIDDDAAIKRLYKIRSRPSTKASPVLASGLSMLQPFIKPVSKNVINTLIKPYWAGALTIVLRCNPNKVNSYVRGGTDTIGVRVPNHLTTLEIINGVGVPIIGTSANFKGGHTPLSMEDLDYDLVKQVDYVVHGKCYKKQASTVVDVTQTPWKVLRQGAIDLSGIIADE